MNLQSMLGTAGASLCCLQPGQLLLTHLTSVPPCLRLSNQGVTPRSQHVTGHLSQVPGRDRTGDPYCCSLVMGRLLPGLGCAWPLPGLNPEMCLAPKLPQGMQDLILCVLSHVAWEESSHTGLFVVSAFSCPALFPSHALGGWAACPATPLREGLLSQQSNYPKCQQEQPHLGPPAHMFCAFCFSSLLHGQKLLCPWWVLAALGSLQQPQHPAHCQPALSAPALLLWPVQIPGR